MDSEGVDRKEKHLLQNQHLQAELKFEAVHVHKPNAFWGKVLRSDERNHHNNKNTVPTVKHGGGTIML